MHENFFHKLKVYYEDTDSGGVVYYANYLKFLERARSEAIYTLGYTNTDIKTFYDALTSLDNSLIVGATKNSLAWFTKKKLSKEVASEIYQPNVRYSTDRETGEINTRYAPRFTVKIPVYNNKISTKIWKDLSWSLNDWTEGGQLEMLGTNDLQLECGYRGAARSRSGSHSFLRYRSTSVVGGSHRIASRRLDTHVGRTLGPPSRP